MIILCDQCRRPAQWSLDRVGDQPILAVKCFACDAQGPWTYEPIDVVRKPKGRAGLWPSRPDGPPLAPVDVGPN